MRKMLAAVAALAALVGAQPLKPMQTQAPSSLSYSKGADGAELVDIRNVSFEVTNSHVPGRPPDERLLLRKTVHSKETIGDIGVEATVTLEAWRFGDTPTGKPLYA